MSKKAKPLRFKPMTVTRPMHKEKSQRVVTFSEFATAVRSRLWLIYLVTLLVILLIELPLRAQAIVDRQPTNLWLAAGISGLLFALIAAWAVPGQWRDWIGLGQTAGGRELLIGLSGGLAGFVWLVAFDALFIRLAPDLYAGYRRPETYQGVQLLLAVLTAGLLRPLGEELLFRGIFLPRLLKKWSFWPAALITALLYGLRTLDPFHFIIYLGTGLVFAVVSYQARLRMAVMANIVFSLLVILASLLFPPM